MCVIRATENNAWVQVESFEGEQRVPPRASHALVALPRADRAPVLLALCGSADFDDDTQSATTIYNDAWLLDAGSFSPARCRSHPQGRALTHSRESQLRSPQHPCRLRRRNHSRKDSHKHRSSPACMLGHCGPWGTGFCICIVHSARSRALMLQVHQAPTEHRGTRSCVA